MPRKPRKQAAAPETPKNFDEFVDDSDGADEDVANAITAAQAASEKLRDWRDVEKYKEELFLRRLIDDEINVDEFAAVVSVKAAVPRKR